MYFDEQIIGGILCWRDTPEGEWKEYTILQLSEMVINLKKATNIYSDKRRRFNNGLS